MSVFTTEDLIISKDAGRAVYKPGHNPTDKVPVGWGQRKLFLNEVSFLTTYYDPAEIGVCVYIGAAPGTHISLVARMFPDLEFHLYDKSPFIIEDQPNITIFDEYYKLTTNKRYVDRDDVIFISDIRRSDYDILLDEFLAKLKKPYTKDNLKDAAEYATQKNEDFIKEDMKLQEDIVLKLNPAHCMLKFRLPYVIDDVVETYDYLRGKVYFQPWAKKNSTEARLIPVRNNNGKYARGKWNTLEYEQWMRYHNIVTRRTGIYENPLKETIVPIDGKELINDYDSTCEAFILKRYFEATDKKAGESEILKLSRELTSVIQSDSNVDIQSNRDKANIHNVFRPK